MITKTISKEGTSNPITLGYNLKCSEGLTIQATVEKTYDQSDWITVTGADGNTKEGTIEINVSANPGNPRTANIYLDIIGGSSGPNRCTDKFIFIDQAGEGGGGSTSCSYNIDAYTTPTCGGEFTVRWTKTEPTPPGPTPPGPPADVCDVTQVSSIDWEGGNNIVIAYVNANARWADLNLPESVDPNDGTLTVNPYSPGDTTITANITQNTSTTAGRGWTIHASGWDASGDEQGCENMSFQVSQNKKSDTPVGTCTTAIFTSGLPINTIFSNALTCTKDKTDDWASVDSNGWTVIIENHLNNYFIPFNGYFALVRNNKGEFNDIQFRTGSNGTSYWYGSTINRSQDTNFLVPPNYKVTLKHCTSTETSSSSSTHFFTSSLLKSSGDHDFKLHNEHIEQCYSSHTVSTSGSYTLVDWDNKTITFVIKTVCLWDGTFNGVERHLGFSADTSGNLIEYYKDFTLSNGNRYVVPINIYRSANPGSTSWITYNPTAELNNMTYEHL